MSIDFATLQGLSIPEGVVTQIADAAGRVIWALAADEPTVILEVAKATISPYVGETEYADESCILLDIYPKKGGTVKVTYGGLTKTIKDTSGAEEPNAQQVYFGTFCGVTDSTTTPVSGQLTIEGAYRGYGRGGYSNSKGITNYCSCITGVVDMGTPNVIGPHTFNSCTNLTLDTLPDSITYIGSYAFNDCTDLPLSILPDSITYIGDYAFYRCFNIDVSTMPSNLTTIGQSAFNMKQGPTNESGATDIKLLKSFCATVVLPSTLQSIGDEAFSTSKQGSDTSRGYYTYISGVVILSTTPPTMLGEAFGGRGETDISNEWPAITITVPAGCGDAYKAAEGWSNYANKIVEAS